MVMSAAYRALNDAYNDDLRSVVEQHQSVAMPVHAARAQALTASHQQFSAEYSDIIKRRDARDAETIEASRQAMAALNSAFALALSSIHDRYKPKFGELEKD